MNKLQEYCRFISTAEIEKVGGARNEYAYTTAVFYFKNAPLDACGEQGIKLRMDGTIEEGFRLFLDWMDAVHQEATEDSEEINRNFKAFTLLECERLFIAQKRRPRMYLNGWSEYISSPN